MCGIGGMVSLDGRPLPVARLRQMAALMRHRGPDDAGYLLAGAGPPLACTELSFAARNPRLAAWESMDTADRAWTIGLAHRRLAIIDLTAAAHQPMGSDDGSAWIVYNGEVYNFRELRAELAERGARCRSRSDTEVVLAAWQHFGADAIQRLNGMFAFGIVDLQRRRLLLARDRFGIKPLYYGINAAGLLAFASEIKPVLVALGLAPELDLFALDQYFAFQNILSHDSLFRGIRLLPPGHTLELSLDGPLPAPRRYWDFHFEGDADPAATPSDDEVARVHDAVVAAVRRQLVADVPLGSFLSGGLDSGALVAVASREIPRLMTFTGGFDLTSVSGLELVFDERGPAELMASRFGTEHYEMVMHAGDMEHILPRLVWHLEEPRLGMSYQNFYISRLASKFVRVVLAGVGGDELFGGYPWRYGFSAPSDYFRYWQRVVPVSEREQFYTAGTFAALRENDLEGVFLQAVRRGPSASSPGALGHGEILAFEARTFLHGLLVVEDRIAMANSLETRVPFLDNELADLALSLPHAYRLGPQSRVLGGPGLPGDPEGTVSSKYVLRKAVRGLVPPEILARRKQGFSPPDGSWYRGPTMEYVRRILLHPRSLERGLVRPEYVRRLVDEHTSGRRNHRLAMWSLLNIEWWHRIFRDNGNSWLEPPGAEQC